jgi:hypothetical protein
MTMITHRELSTIKLLIILFTNHNKYGRLPAGEREMHQTMDPRLKRKLEKPILKRWTDIDHAVSLVLDEMEAIPPNGPSALEGIDPFKEVLGCGHFGCVYRTNYKEFAVKLTTDSKEADITAFIMQDDNLHFHPGIALFISIWQLHEYTIEDDPIYIILREYMETYEKRNPKIDRAIKSHLKTSMMLEASKIELEEEYSMWQLRDYKKALKKWESSLKKLYNIPQTKYIADFMELCGENEVFLSDVHSSNLGKRLYDLRNIIPQAATTNNYLSIFDIGASEIELADIPSPIFLPAAWEENPEIPIL